MLKYLGLTIKINVKLYESEEKSFEKIKLGEFYTQVASLFSLILDLF